MEFHATTRCGDSGQSVQSFSFLPMGPLALCSIPPICQAPKPVRQHVPIDWPAWSQFLARCCASSRPGNYRRLVGRLWMLGGPWPFDVCESLGLVALMSGHPSWVSPKQPFTLILGPPDYYSIYKQTFKSKSNPITFGL
eukprot:4663050-Amphidinium_carterae.3